MKNIYQKIIEVAAKCGSVEKTGKNLSQKYKYIEIHHLVDSLRSACLEHGLCILSTLESVEHHGDKTHVVIKWVVVDADNPSERIEMLVPGTGWDKTDKAIYKAITGSRKYFYTLLFQVSAGDDAEKDGKAQTERQIARQENGQVKPKNFPKVDILTHKIQTPGSSFNGREIGSISSEELREIATNEQRLYRYEPQDRQAIIAALRAATTSAQ